MITVEQLIFQYFERFKHNMKAQPLNLGGLSGTGGGVGGPPGGFIGYLPQTRVGYDTSEVATFATTNSGTLLDNLNHMRARLNILEASGIGGSAGVTTYQNNTFVASGTKLDFVGATVTPIAGGSRITITSSGGGGGNVYGSSSVTNGHLAVFDTDGYHIKDGGAVPTSSGGGHTIQVNGSSMPTQPTLDIVGAGISGTNDTVNSRTIITIVSSGSGGGGHVIQGNGSDMPSESKLNFTGNVTITDDSINNRTTINVTTSGGGSGSTDGWITSGQTWTYESSDAPTYTFSEPIDATNKYSAGMKIKCTQGGSVKYGIITNVGSYSGGKTILTAYLGTDYTLGATISNPYYSISKSPLGFPLDPTKWHILVTNSSDLNQNAPTTNTWYNLGSLSITVPIGAWYLGYQGAFQGDVSAENATNVVATLSTTNNGDSNPYFESIIIGYAAGSTINTVSKKLAVNIESKTTYYLNECSIIAAGAIHSRGDLATILIMAECAYL